MTSAIDHTHDPKAVSWVETANAADADFPLQNLPYGSFRPANGEPRIGVAIGDRILDLSAAEASGHLDGLDDALRTACRAENLNPLMALGRDASQALRHRVFELLESSDPRKAQEAGLLHELAAVEMLLPAAVGDYTDFYASIFHATNVGKLFRPDNPLLPNYKWVPIGYHGRASTLVPTGTPVRRPKGQRKPPDTDTPSFETSRLMDYEMEVGFFFGGTHEMGKAIPIGEAGRHLFGFCLVNDWSARDLQAWEYQPLGPFLAKSFATTVSPWVVTAEALAPFHCAAFDRPEGDPKPLPHLFDTADQEGGNLDMQVEVLISTAEMRKSGKEPHLVSRGNFRDMYWTPAQMLAHHASNGCLLQAGDLMASGTVSNEAPGTQGCLLELTRRGAEKLKLPSGEERAFLEDGDEITLRAFCEADGHRRIGFGSCKGAVIPAE